MSVDKFGRFYTGSLDKFGRYHPYGLDQTRSEVVGKPLEIPKPTSPKKLFSETTVALYGANRKYSEYVTYNGNSGKITTFSVPEDCILLLDDQPLYNKLKPIRKGQKLRLYTKNSDIHGKKDIVVNVLGSNKKTVQHKFSVSFLECRVFRFLQQKGKIVKDYLPGSCVCFVNGHQVGKSLVGLELIFNDTISIYPTDKDSECESFFVIRSPVGDEY